MKLMQLGKASLVGFGALAFVACSHAPKNGTGSPSGVSAEGQSAETYAVKSQQGYQGETQKNQYGEIINPLVAPANQTYYFAFDSSTVRSSDFRAINIQANYLATHANAKVRLEGNTDNRGSREYNVGLGWRRDQAIARMLEQQGVAPKQIDMVSYGKERPAVMGNNEQAWRLNRRVHLVYEAY